MPCVRGRELVHANTKSAKGNFHAAPPSPREVGADRRLPAVSRYVLAGRPPISRLH
jgi:hypothetical protein